MLHQDSSPKALQRHNGSAILYLGFQFPFLSALRLPFLNLFLCTQDAGNFQPKKALGCLASCTLSRVGADLDSEAVHTAQSSSCLWSRVPLCKQGPRPT